MPFFFMRTQVLNEGDAFVVILTSMSYTLVYTLISMQVVLSQCSGSNKSGFNIIPSNRKGTVRLDGVFNIISYDIVPKLQDTLMASDFKASAASYLIFLKAFLLF